jgi:uncharacterized protein
MAAKHDFKKIIPELKKLGIAAVYLFGSKAENVSSKLSDVDIGVVLNDPTKLDNSTIIYNRLYDLFTEVFDTSNFKTIDIVFLQKAPLELRFDVIKNGKVLFENSEELRSGFEDNTQMKYIDFKPILNNFNKQIINRI